MVAVNLTNLKPGTTYTVYATAFTSDGVESDPSEILTFTTPADVLTSVNKTNTIKLDGGAIFAGTLNPGPGVLFNKDGLTGWNGSTKSFSIDSLTGNAYFAGSVVAAAGTIGGWNIGTNDLNSTVGNGFYMNSQYGYIQLGTVSPSIVVMHNSQGFMAGSNDPTTASFYIDLSGNLRANSASIKGNINATSGSFTGGIYGASLSGGTLNINNKFIVDNAGNASVSGNIVANSGSFLGAITASVGKIGGFTLQSNSLSAQNVVLASDTGLNLGAGVFSVNQAGALKATSASITGNIVAQSGSFTGDLSISSTGRLIAGDLSSNFAIVSGAGISGGNNANMIYFNLPTDGSNPTIGGFQIVKTGLIAVGQASATVSGTVGQTTITVPLASASNLWIGMAASGAGIATSALVIGISGTTVSLSAPNTGAVSGTGYFTPNANLIVGTSASNSINVRGQSIAGQLPAIYTVIGASATTDSSGNGFYIGQDGKFRLAGNNGYISMDGTGNLFVSGTINAASGNFTGTITSSVGKIGGWSLAASSLYATNILLDTASGIVLGSGSQVKLTPGGTASLLNIYASGTIIANSGSFTGGIYGASISGGILNITSNASIGGYINATSGSFTGAISGASITGGIFKTSGTSSYVQIDGSKDAISFSLGGSAGAHIVPYITGTGVQIHSGSVANNTSSLDVSQYPVVKLFKGFIELGLSSANYLRLGATGIAPWVLQPGGNDIQFMGGADIQWDKGNYGNYFYANSNSIAYTDTIPRVLLSGMNSSRQGTFAWIARDQGASPQTNASPPLYLQALNGNSGTGPASARMISFFSGSVLAGFLYAPTSTTMSLANGSDYRLKTNINPIVNSNELISKLNPVTFDWKNSEDHSPMHGFIAHELQEVLPYAVYGEKDAVDENGNPEYQYIDTKHIIPVLAAGLKDAYAKIEQLESRLAALENK